MEIASKRVSVGLIIFYVLTIATTTFAQSAPHIISVAASTVAVGGRIWLNGSSFGDTQGSSTVTLNGTAGTLCPITFPWSNSAICISVPMNAPLGATVVQVNTSAGSSNTVTVNVEGQPAISGVSPSNVAIGGQVTITGVNFGPTQDSILYLGVSNFRPAIVSWSDTQIVATVPSTARAGNGYFQISALGYTLNSPTFAIVGPPQIISVAASTVAVGGRIWLNGSSFGDTQGSSTVTLNGVAGTLCPITGPWSNSGICISVPMNAPLGATVVQVRTSAGSSNTVTVNIEGQPAISAVNPSNVAIGNQVTITGVNFGPTQDSILYLGVSNFRPAIVSWSDTQIVATIPSTARAGNGYFQISALGYTLNSPTFAIVGPPQIISVAASTVAVGGRIWLNGSSFGDTQGNSTVTLNGVAGTLCPITYPWSNSAVCIGVPMNAPLGATVVQVNTSAGLSNTVTVNVEGQPAISAVNPSNVAIGSQVTITGVNFGPTQDSILYLGVSNFRPPIVSWSDTQIVVTIPGTAAAGSGYFQINALGYALNSPSLTIAAAPAVTSLVPNSGVIGTQVTISGSDFGASPGQVVIGGQSLNVSNWNDTSIVATIPAGTATGNVVITTSTGLSITGPGFTVLPAISSITPANGFVGSQVTITGSGFGAGQGQVTLGTQAMSVSSWSDNSITAAVPVGATTGSIAVITSAGLSSNGSSFGVSFPVLRVSVSDTPLNVNLTSAQNLDWVHWGRLSADVPDRKAGVTPLISNYSLIAGTQASASSGIIAFSWSDGDHSPLVSENTSDIETQGGGGFQLTVPADITVKTLNLYVELYGGTGILQASLSDGSAPAITDQSVADLDFGSKTYCIDFRAASAGQTLTVTYSAGAGAGVGLQAATLTPHLPVVSIVSPTAAQQVTAPGSIPVNVSASQFDNSIADIKATGSEGTVLEMPGSPLNANWGPLPGGHHSVTATAFDGAGLAGTSNPVEFDVIGQGGTLSIGEVAPPPSVDLDSEGTADWILWGAQNLGDFVVNHPGNILARKSGVAPLISEYKPIGNHFINSQIFAHSLCFTSGQQGYCSGSDIGVHGQGDGFEFTVAADTTPRILQLYVTTFSADAKVVAFLSDGSAPVVTELDGGSPLPPSGTATSYSIAFSAASSGQTLTVRLTLNSDQGGGEVDLIGATLSGPSVAPSVPSPQITSVTPGSAPTDARITITGTNFGTIQGDSYVQIGGELAQVVSWSDTSIVVVVPSSLFSGNTVDVTVFTDYGISNIAALNILSYKIYPASINLLIGQSRTLSAVDVNGNPVTGLPWSTTDPTVVTLSPDDPPAIIALAPGSARVWAGDISVPVTVYSGTSLPAGTPIWSLPVEGGASSVLSLVPAVPSDSGVDVFALDSSGTLSAVTTDGTIKWKAILPETATTWRSGVVTIEPSTVIPDFRGQAVIIAPQILSEGNCITRFTHKVAWVNASNGHLVDLHVFSSNRLPGTVPSCPGDAGIYSDNNTTEVVIPHTSGPVFIQDNATITLMDPTTAQVVTTAVLDPSTENGLIFAPGLPSFIGKMIVAGDGNAYVPYVFKEIQYDSSAAGLAIHTISHLMLLSMSPDGTTSKTELKTWIWDFTHTDTSSSSCGGCFEESNRGSVGTIRPEAAITDADTGVTIFAQYGDICSNRVHTSTSDQSTICADYRSYNLMTIFFENTIASQIDHIAVDAFTPVLQREDGSYIGTESSNITALAHDGTVLWQQNITDAYGVPVFATPLYATADGGIIATTTTTTVTHYDPNDPSNQSQITRVINTKLGTLYTLDSNGTVTTQSADIGAKFSWKGAYQIGSVDSMDLPRPSLATTFAAVMGGNLTGNGTAMVHHSFGLVWCGVGYSEVGFHCAGADDVPWIYTQASPLRGDETLATLLIIGHEFSSDHPDWVNMIKQSALEAYKKAFDSNAVTIQLATRSNHFFGGLQYDQDFVAKVSGSWPAPAAGLDFPGSDIGKLSYLQFMIYSQSALGQPSGRTLKKLEPPYPPRTAKDVEAFHRLAQAIGKSIGNGSAHETGHYLEKQAVGGSFFNPGVGFPLMDCGLGNPTMERQFRTHCENDDNFVYNFFSAFWESQDTTDLFSGGGDFFYKDLPGRTIHWSLTNECWLQMWNYPKKWKDLATCVSAKGKQ